VETTESPTALKRAPARLDDVVQRHANLLRHPDRLVGAVDRPRIPSPGMDRDISPLHDQLEGVLHDIRDFRARTAFPAKPRTDAGIAALRQDAHRLAEELAQHWDREAHVILDSVNTDIGAGD